MEKNYHLYLSKEAALHRAVGDAITRWARLEWALVETFSNAIGCPNKTGAAIFSNVKTFSLLLDITNSAVQCRLSENQEIKHWNSLVEYIRELSGDRNYMAHTGTVAYAPGHPDEVDWAIAEAKIGPSTINYLHGNNRFEPMDTLEAEELSRDMQQALEFTMEFSHALANGKTSQEKFYSPISRRRPTRKQRLEDAKKAP